MNLNALSFARFVVIASLLAGCVSRPDYQASTAPTAVSLQIRTTHDGINMPIRTYSAADCGDYPGKMIGRFNSKTIGETAYRRLDTAIAANEPFRLSVMAVVALKGSLEGSLLRGGVITSEVTYCQPVVEFMPQPGSAYEAVHEVQGSSCAISVFVMRNGIRQPEPSARVSPTCPHRFP